MQRELAAFAEHPTRATYVAAREAVMRRSPLAIASTDFAALERLFSDQAYRELLDRLSALPPSKILSPRIHFLAAEAAEALGDASAVELERSLFVLTLQGLLATGDGTRGNPYLICHATDEYDILEALGQESARQTLVEHEGRMCDVLRCTDGREVWFDVTPIISRPSLRKSRTVRLRMVGRSRRLSRAAR